MNSLAILNLLRLELNKINSNLYMDLLDEELEDYFNQAQEEYISNIFTPNNKDKAGFEMSEKRITDLGNLVVENYSDILYSAVTDITTTRYTFALPSDFKWHLASKLQSYYHPINQVTFSFTPQNSFIALIPVNPGDIYDFSGFNIKRQSDSTSLFNTTSSFINYHNPNNIKAFIENILNVYNSFASLDYAIYYENFQGTFYPNTLIIVRLVSNASNIKYTFDGTNYTNLNFTLKSNLYPANFSGGFVKTFATRQQQHDKAKALNSHIATATDVREPMITRSGNTITVHTDGKFIPQKLFLDYFRKPKHISVKLQQDCELPDNVVLEILGRVYTHIKANTDPASYQLIQNEENKTS